uniref:Adrenocorticotropic hormone receptor n=1 Tax=Denticeps clupeoides TaxID=299321 RepID=A0AAY4E6S4_9TELE
MSNDTTASTTSLGTVTDCPEIQVPHVVFLAIGVLSLAENLLVVLAVACNRKLHSPMYLFICNLAVFNTLSSLSTIWETIMLAVSSAGHLDPRGASERRLDDVMDALLCTSFLGSFCSFLAIAADRYATIFRALRYHVIVTGRRVAATLAVIWALCGTGGVLMVTYFHNTTVMVSFITLFLAALFLILLLYGHMFLLARKHAQNIATLPGRGGVAGGHTWRHGWRNMRAALTLMMLFGVFVACWAPFFLHLLLLVLCPLDPYCECYRSLFQPHLLLVVSHGAIDPAIYAFRSVEIRHAFWRMVLCASKSAFFN